MIAQCDICEAHFETHDGGAICEICDRSFCPDCEKKHFGDIVDICLECLKEQKE